MAKTKAGYFNVLITASDILPYESDREEVRIFNNDPTSGMWIARGEDARVGFGEYIAPILDNGLHDFTVILGASCRERISIISDSATAAASYQTA